MRTRSSIVIVAILLALTAGCANTGSTSGSPASSSASPPAPTSSEPSPTKGRGTEPSGEITVTGKVVSGVEPGCRVLQTTDKSYLLIAQGPQEQALKVGATVTVKGEVKSDMATTCMQGTPLVVSSVTPS
jgi:hypothetical protein